MDSVVVAGSKLGVFPDSIAVVGLQQFCLINFLFWCSGFELFKPIFREDSDSAEGGGVKVVGDTGTGKSEVSSCGDLKYPALHDPGILS